MKSGSTWRHLIKLDNIDACFFLTSMQSLPLLDAVRNFYKTYFPKLPQKCPVEPGKYSVTNVTVTDNKHGNEGEKLMKQITPMTLPNGLYRHLLRLSNSNDTVGLTLYWHTRIDISMNENEF